MKKFCLIVAILSLVMVFSCKKNTKTPPVKGKKPTTTVKTLETPKTPTKPPSPAPKVNITLPEKSSGWSGTSQESGFSDRYAVLVGVDQYKNKPGWNLPFVKNNLEKFKKTLVDDLKFNPDNIKTLAGEKATRESVQDALENGFYKKMQGRDNLVLFYYSGHGFVNTSTRHQHFLTYYSSTDGENRFSKTIRDMEIREWFLNLKKKLPEAVGFLVSDFNLKFFV